MQYAHSSSTPDGVELSYIVLVDIQLQLKWSFKTQSNVTLVSNKVANDCHHKVQVSYEGM